MSILTNKHFVIALIVTPVLAIIAYFGVDSFVSETPQAAVAGARYELVEKPNCRYNSGVCGLKNGNFELKLTVDWLAGGAARLNMKSIFPLEGVRVAMLNPDRPEGPPRAMQSVDKRGLDWVAELERLDPKTSRLRLAVVSNKTFYYGEVGSAFAVYETAFGEDFRNQED